MGIRLKFVARKSKAKSFTLRDGRVVKRNQAVEVETSEATTLFRNPGESDDTNAEWIRATREEVG